MKEMQNIGVPYEIPAISSYTEAELMESMEVWGASGGVTPYTPPGPAITK